VPKRNFPFEKRQKELARKQKQEEKRQRRLDRPQKPQEELAPPGALPADPPPRD